MFLNILLKLILFPGIPFPNKKLLVFVNEKQNCQKLRLGP